MSLFGTIFNFFVILLSMNIHVKRVPKYFNRSIIEKWSLYLAKLFMLEYDIVLEIKNIKRDKDTPKGEMCFGLCNVGDGNWHEITINSILLKDKVYVQFLDVMVHEFFHCIDHEKIFDDIGKIKEDDNWDKKVSKVVDRHTTKTKRAFSEDRAYNMGFFLSEVLYPRFKKDLKKHGIVEKWIHD